MSAHKSRKEAIEYNRYKSSLKQGFCQFCELKEDEKIEKTKNFMVIKNIFSYSIFDAQDVEDHLMIIPNKHIVSISKIPKNQKVEYMELLQKYEKQGYNIYARAAQSKIKTVIHQHTHLIKTSGRPKRLIFRLLTPYIRIAK